MLGTILRLAVVCMIVLLSAPVGAQIPVRINWTAVTGAQSGMFMAQQEGTIQEERLGCRTYSTSLQARAESKRFSPVKSHFPTWTASNAAQANLKGANIAFVAGATNRQVFSLMAKPEFKRITDLRGKKIGITRVGSSTHTSALFALEFGGIETGGLSDFAVARGAEYSTPP